MLALRDAREAHDVLAIVARSLGRDFKRPCVAYELRDAVFRSVVASDVAREHAPISRKSLDLEALRGRGLLTRAGDDLVGVLAQGQIRALLLLERSEVPLGDEEIKYLRALAVHVSLALENALAFEQLRRYAAEGAALTEAARTILGFTELAPLATALCRLGVRLVHAERACAYACRGDSLALVAQATLRAGLAVPERLPLETMAAQRELDEAFAGSSVVATRIAMPGSANGHGQPGLLAFARTAPFEKGELRLLESLLTLAALAIRNVDLYEQSTNAARALAESNAFKDDLMAMFAHDFKGPLTVISGFSELLFDSGDPNVQRSAQTIVEQTRRLAKLSDDALALAATQSTGFSLQRTTEDITEFVWSVAVPLDRAGRRLVLRAPPEPVLLSFDRSRLRHVIDNVVGNALKYSGDRVEVRIARAEDGVRIAVSDRGIGIPAAEIDRIFSRFGRATNARSRGISGSGVGLYIAKKIVDVHGGRLEAQSVENEGSTFTICLPA